MAPPVLEQDLNAAPLPDDPQEVLIHPLHPMALVNLDLNEAEISIQQPVQLEVMEEVVNENHPIIESQAQVVPDQQINFPPLEILEEDLMDDLEIQNLQNHENAQNMKWQQEGNVIINNIHLGMVRIEDSFFST
jgi:hypothetical protein